MTATTGPGQVSDEWLAQAAVALGDAAALVERLAPAIPAGYDELNSPTLAAIDFPTIAAIADGACDLDTAFVHDTAMPVEEWRFRVYVSGKRIALADLLPLLDQLGLRALDERAFSFEVGGRTVRLHDVGVGVPAGLTLDDTTRDGVRRAFEATFRGEVEVDGFNRLVLFAGLAVREVEVVRAYARYLRQIGFPFSQQYIEAALIRHATITRSLAALFDARFDPRTAGTSPAAEAGLRAQIVEALEVVPSLDDDRTLRTFLALIDATLRTNVYRPGDDTPHRPVMSFKFDPTKVPDVPLPRPMFEIWVCAPNVEGVHLRGGRIARGGIRWSDRREDFRTEVLGLVKAQMVKNAVIVPTGAKGGFVLKRAVPDADVRAEAVACYRDFISGLLDITDDIVDGVVVPPPDVVRYDGDDAYLVVAADKGTATFSDIANEISANYGFWLGDAFASGGSAGYDHKEMGITARGAWESVRRHARAIGRDADRDALTFVGIGDMSGDVFGNGMLRSQSMLLVAAFDHRHVFLDPAPDAAESFAERQRLFALPRSTWADYDPAVISDGGGVHPRNAKSIDVSPAMRKVLGNDRATYTPAELISAILRAPVDVLWNGGIGTYIKASTESHADVGDRANDTLRVNANELRCKIVAEGGNLGVTQSGRIEYALAGGLVYTDAIDNSAGVDCSDHEVNIKILLRDVMGSTPMTLAERDALLAEMTDDVAELVLDDNRAQTLALAIARRQSFPMANVHARYMTQMALEGSVDRRLEFLPNDKQLDERQSTGVGLTTPEFAVLLAYTKMTNIAETAASALPDDPYLESDLFHYFPRALQERFPQQIARHRLRREIIATQVGNQLVNISGISFDHRITEDTGVTAVDVTRAWVAVRDIFDVARSWDTIDALGTDVRLDAQLELFLDLRKLVERSVSWVLRHRRPPIDIAAVVADFAAAMRPLSGELDDVLTGRMRDATFALEAARLTAGVPEALAQSASTWPVLHTMLDVIELARTTGREPRDVACTFWQVFETLDLGWLWDAIASLPRSDRWQTQARSALRDDLLATLADLTGDVLSAGSVARWLDSAGPTAPRASAMFMEIRRAEISVTTLSVALRQLRNLALTVTRGA